jgi:hypothetical protein
MKSRLTLHYFLPSPDSLNCMNSTRGGGGGGGGKQLGLRLSKGDNSPASHPYFQYNVRKNHNETPTESNYLFISEVCNNEKEYLEIFFENYTNCVTVGQLIMEIIKFYFCRYFVEIFLE